ncbi:phage GP46 family protein [Sodalis sp. (in: enterobacteria)]|uniref:phage GP46 family protein n=1 Tax=Sodalis sp. (in: enterobacteria) TaxID=1898979 RepID=UPI003F687360
MYELARAKDSATTRRLAQQYAEQALQPLLADNCARRIDVRVSRPAQGDLRLHIDVVAANGNLQTFTHPVKGHLNGISPWRTAHPHLYRDCRHALARYPQPVARRRYCSGTLNLAT